MVQESEVKQLQNAEIVMTMTLDYSRLPDPITNPFLTISYVLEGYSHRQGCLSTNHVNPVRTASHCFPLPPCDDRGGRNVYSIPYP